MLYEDDFEFEEQPANIRDRNIPGKGGSGPREGGNRTGGYGGGGGRRGPGGYGGGRNFGGGGGHFHRGPSAPGQPLPENAKSAHALLDTLLNLMGVQHAEIAFIPRPEGEYLEVTGPDLAMLIGRHGNTLEAINLIFNNMINIGVRNNRRYYTIDAEGYRARRAEQLKNLAFETVERVLLEKKPQKMEPMLPSERKIVHLSIQDNELVRTESEGEEPERCVVIFPT